MAEVELKCPSCGRVVHLGDIECPHCGVNLKSGETFETRVKRARGKAKHPEGLTGSIYIGVAIVFLLVSLAGYFYQSRMEDVIEEKPELFVERIERIQHIEDLDAAGQYAEAREEAAALAEELKQEAEKIKPEQAYAPDNSGPFSRKRRQWDKRGAKRLLNNLRAKVERKLEQLPQGEQQE